MKQNYHIATKVLYSRSNEGIAIGKHHHLLSVEGSRVFNTVGHSHPILLFVGKVLILSLIGYAPALPKNIVLGWKWLIVTNSLSWNRINYSKKSFIKQVPWMNHNEENHYFLSIEGVGVFFTVGHLHPSLMFAGKVLILIEWVDSH